MEKDLKLRKFEAESMSVSQREYVERFPYQNIVGALLYLSINTRPDISYAVGVLARFCKNPNFRAYLRGTAERGIRYTGDDLNVHAYSDADWAGDLDSRRSTTGCGVCCWWTDSMAVEVADDNCGLNDGG